MVMLRIDDEAIATLVRRSRNMFQIAREALHYRPQLEFATVVFLRPFKPFLSELQ